MLLAETTEKHFTSPVVEYFIAFAQVAGWTDRRSKDPHLVFDWKVLVLVLGAWCLVLGVVLGA